MIVLNEKLVEELMNLKGEGTIYFKKRSLQTHPADIWIYKIVCDFINQNIEFALEEKSYQYQALLRFWYYSMLRFCERTEFPKEPEEESEVFYKIIKKHLEDLDEETKMQVFYRFPWHLRTWMVVHRGKSIDVEMIEELASWDPEDLATLDFKDTSYFQVAGYDRWALLTMQDDITLNNQEDLRFQLQENLFSMVYYIENMTAFIQKKLPYEDKDQHGLNIIAFLMLKVKKQEANELSYFEFYLHTLAALCFWHVEATLVDSEWLLKKGKFSFFKEHAKEVRKWMLGLN